MGLLDGLEKLITEHGSAAILKERIALANDKYAALERKASELEGTNRHLKRENDELKEKLRNHENQAAQRGGGGIDEVDQKLLLLLAQSGELRKEQIARALGVGEELAAFHIGELEVQQFIDGHYSYMGPTTYGLAQEGRRYLVQHGLLK